ncbi:MAG: arylesterase [Lautropia sp.]|nr:arylesterase [Lautropia sp.]
MSSNASGPAGASASDRAPVLLVLGDSLSAEYGLRRGQGWVALLGERIQQQAGKLKHQEWRVVNASISGETTVGGRTRLPRLLQQHRPALTLIELGGNDGLRGLPIQTVSANLRQMIESAQAQGSQVLLIGMQMPPNYGPAYARQFQQMYQSLARDTGSALVPFLLEGFGSDRDWFQPDGIHPNATAQPKMLDNVWPTLKPLL